MFCGCIVCQSISVNISINKSGLRQTRVYLYAAPTPTQRTSVRARLPIRRTGRKPRGDSPEENGASTSCRFSIVSRVPLGPSYPRRGLAPLVDCTETATVEKIGLRRDVCDAGDPLGPPAGAPWEPATERGSSARPSRDRDRPRRDRGGTTREDLKKNAKQKKGPWEKFVRGRTPTHPRVRPRARASHTPHRALYTRQVFDRWIRGDPPSIARPRLPRDGPPRSPAPNTYPKYAHPLSRDSHLASLGHVASASPGAHGISVRARRDSFSGTG